MLSTDLEVARAQYFGLQSVDLFPQESDDKVKEDKAHLKSKGRSLKKWTEMEDEKLSRGRVIEE